MLTVKDALIRDPIITSVLDNDLYKLTMGSVVFHLFPRARVTYTFINRGKTPFPEGFAEALKNQIWLMSFLGMTRDEKRYLNTIPYLRPTYVEWLSSYRYDPNEVDVSQNASGHLQVTIYGYWYRTIFWEVPLMAVISQLYFEMTGQTTESDYYTKMHYKGSKLAVNKCHWIDFGTRRRFSYHIQDRLVHVMSGYQGCLGTSNVHFAHKYGIPAHGTYAHEYVMGMQALYGARMANEKAIEHWSEHFDGLLGTALTDTFTTANFLKSFGPYAARLFDGVRQDSGDPVKWGDHMLKHYDLLGIPTANKRFVFSDGLDTDLYISLDKKFREHCQPVGGIGTHFTNDVGVKPLNMVIKLATANFGQGKVDVVKLSDNAGKHTGTPEAIVQVKQELGIL